jgi:hypothetical protein
VDLGADGSRQGGGWYDNQLDTRCYPSTAADGTLRCLPFPTDSIYYFAAAKCTEKLADVNCGAKYASEYADACPSYQRIYKLGSVDNGYYYYLSGSTCTRGSLLANNAYYYVGDELLPDSFVKITEVTE